MDNVDENLRIRYGYHVESYESLGRQPLDYDTWVKQTLTEDDFYVHCCEWFDQSLAPEGLDDLDEKFRIRYEYHVEACECLGRQPLDYDTWLEQTLEDDFYAHCCEWFEQTQAPEEHEEIAIDSSSCNKV